MQLVSYVRFRITLFQFKRKELLDKSALFWSSAPKAICALMIYSAGGATTVEWRLSRPVCRSPAEQNRWPSG
jgi:hypothetical protein